jgi:hypothetical protein
VRTIVDQAGAAGLFVVLDMHQWHWSPCFGGNGMPTWATTPCLGISADQSNGAIEALPETLFWLDGDLQRRFAAMWRVVAEKVGHPTISSATTSSTSHRLGSSRRSFSRTPCWRRSTGRSRRSCAPSTPVH